ncbi:uncharacterized protein [Solanum lycopersicum]|uniref:uncharacterized protein n=1 Tax=Solanum lycopersicum TaxID=4081 RepID=UPI0037493492
MSRFGTSVANLLEEECRMDMLHSDMTLSWLMVYAQSIEESKLKRITRNLRRSGPSLEHKPRFKKRAQSQDGPNARKVKLEKVNSSQNGKTTCDTCGKRHYGECLIGTDNFFICGKDGHNMRDCNTVASRGREGKKVTPSVPGNAAPKKNRFYALRARGSKPYEDDDDGGNVWAKLTEDDRKGLRGVPKPWASKMLKAATFCN